MASIINTFKGKWHRLRTLVQWLPKAHTIDTIDSPHLYNLVKAVFWKELEWDEKLQNIELRRAQLLQSAEELIVKDLGYGSFKGKTISRSVKEITKNAVSSKNKCLLLYKLALHFAPETVLELGTSMGISTLYLQAAIPKAEVTSVEGDLSILGIASSHQLDWANSINYINGSFKQAMDQLLLKEAKIDLLYIDGSHHSASQKELLPYYKGLSHDKSVWIIDDIYWSDDMTDWWNELKGDPIFDVAIDMYHFGILYKNSEILEKLDVKILPKKIRWKLGLMRYQN